MKRCKLMTMSIGLVVGLAGAGPRTAAAAGSPTALADPRPSPVTSVEAKGDKLVVIAAGKSLGFDGHYEGPGRTWLEFEDGRLVAFAGEDGRKQAADGITIRDGKVVLVGSAGETTLGDGAFERQGDPQPQPRDPEPQPRPNPNGFRVHDGTISDVW